MFGASNTGFGGFGQQNQQQQQQQPPGQQPGGGLFGGAGGAFGSSAFGASSTPAFGQPGQPAQNTGFGGFGATPSAAPAFGSTTSTAPAFGQPASTGGGLFGSNPTQQPASTGFSFGGGGTPAFGSSSANAAGTVTGGLFGAAKPATTGFGGFGQPAQQQQQQPAAGGGLFGGASTGAFGAAAPAGQGNGTAVAPYQSTPVLEPPAEEGKPPPTNQTAHQFQSITCMPQYKNYSFEELRLQDYQANRKGPSAAPAFGSAFGSTSAPAFGAPAPSTGGGLFGSSTSTTFGSAAPATSGFGTSTTTGGGLFGSTAPATNAFGQPATSQPAQGGGLFGSAASQPTQTGGLFGSAPSAGGAFGQPAASAAPAFGGFGAAAKPATTGFSFGAGSTTTPASTGGGLFGSTQPATSQPGANPFGQPATGGGLFGSQPAGQTSAAPSFSFGATANKPLFGAAAPPTSTPAFGAPGAASTAPKPAFSFGAAPAATGGGLFGNQQNQQQQQQAPAFGAPAPATGGGLFGGGASTFGQPAAAGGSTFGGGGLFGAKPAAPATGGGLFGSTTQPATGGGLFGQSTAQQPQQQQSLFGSTAPSGGFSGSLFGGGASTASQPGQQQPTAYASAEDANAYGSNPLFANVGTSPVRPVEEKKKPPIFTAFRGTPVNRSSTKITRLRGFGTSSTASPAAGASPLSFGASVGASGAQGTPGTPARGSPLRLVNGLSDEVAMSPNAFVSRPSVKKLVIDRKTLGRSLASPAKDGAGAGTTPGGRTKVTFNPEVEVPSRSTLFGASTASRAGEDENSFAASEGVTDGNTTFDSPSALKTTVASSSADWPARRPPATAAPPKHGEYYTIPSLDTLQKLPASKLRAVPDLVVGRVGYGQVAFSEPVDLTTLDSVEDLLGGIVRLEDRNATVYPDEYDEIKPAPGQGLNVPATITLENCFPLDKATRKPIKERDHPRVQQHVKRLRNLDGTEFIDFEPETGKWTFQVHEF
ncbi:hypothetical protein JCM21900_001028 [Sporobolomyces salmonicolor]